MAFEYNEEDYYPIIKEFKELKTKGENNTWEKARLAHEATRTFDLKFIAEKIDENYNYLKLLSSIAGKYSIEEQELYGITLDLTFSHFIAAAKSDKRLEWLKKAADNKWSAARLRREISPPKPVVKKEPEPITPLPVTPMVIEQTRSQGRTLEEMVGALNWYLVNDKRSLELAAPNALLFVCLLLGEERTVVFNENTGEYVIQ